MDNINDLIGDAAKQLMAQADGIQNQKLKASAQRVARTVSAKTRDELISVARSDAYGRDTRFIKYLPITWRQKAVMGRVYSFQCTTNKDGTPGEFRMKSGELAFTDALNEEDAKRIEVVSLLKCVPGIGASKAEAIRRLVKIPLGRRVSGLGIRQREELTALEKNGWKMTAQKSKAL